MTKKISTDITAEARQNRISSFQPRPADSPVSDLVSNDKTLKQISITKTEKEAKSKRVNLILKPSTYARAKAYFQERGVSFNDGVSQLLDQL